MIDKIIETIYDDLYNGVGFASTYTDDKVDDIQKQLPDTLLTNTFIGIEKRDLSATGFELGQRQATQWNYVVDIVILCKDLDWDAGVTRLAKIFKRVRKTLFTSNLLSLSETFEGSTEQVYNVTISRTDFDSGIWADKKLAHIAVLTLEVKTQLNY